LNCGLEDVRVLTSYLEKHSISSQTNSEPGETDKELAAALHDYSTNRHEDLKAICELALQN
jgi:kynurenine 3-monooxygenase